MLSENFEDIYAIMKATEEDINALDDFGGIMAKSVVEFFKKEETKQLIEKLVQAGVNIKGQVKELKSHSLEGKTFVVTGSFDGYTRPDIAKIIEDNAGKFSTTISKKTSYLVAGEDAGSKLRKA